MPTERARTRGSRTAAVPARRQAALLCAALAGAVAPLAGCSSSGGGGAAASAASSAIFSAASSGASVLQSAAASAASAAASQLAGVKNAVNAKGDISVGKESTGADGRATAELTATNRTSGTADYTVAVEFRDQSGNLLDMTVVDIQGVAAGGSKTATVRSNRSLQGPVAVSVTTALRH